MNAKDLIRLGVPLGEFNWKEVNWFLRGSTARAEIVSQQLLQPAQGTAQGFNFALVGVLLSLGQFHELEHFVHLLLNAPERFDNARDFVNGLADG